MTSMFLKRAKSLFGQAEPETNAAVPRKPTKLFHAVTIAPGYKACGAAKALRNQRFLSREAPPLPLKDCGSPECECRYEHYDDRRLRGRRARELGVSIDGYDGDEQRTKSKRGRRTTDS
jgi:hypothetical protein